MLGRSSCLDGTKELSFMSASTMDTFLKDFCRKFAAELYPTWVRPPTTLDEIAEVMRVHKVLGIKRAMGSTDMPVMCMLLLCVLVRAHESIQCACGAAAAVRVCVCVCC
jgi:hypothetical protein